MRALAACIAFAVTAIAGPDDPMVVVSNLADQIVGLRYVCSFPRSMVEQLPRWKPLEGEPPLSPHAAAEAALEHVRRRLPHASNFTVASITLHPVAAGKEFGNPQLENIWAYHVSFDSTNEVRRDETALLTVVVLMDGHVAPTTTSPLKE